MQPPSAPDQRRATLARLASECFDLVVVGGGINGAAIARDAALRGYRVALVERRDWASGTSSRSSRLIHGGLRYLEHGELALVAESLAERRQLSRLARHLVRPLPFVAPVYRGDRWPAALVELGLWIYDALALFQGHARHQYFGPRRLVGLLPGLRQQELRGGVLYYDGQTDDARLVLENVLDARQAGAAAASYCALEAFETLQGRVATAALRDQLSGARLQIRGRCWVLAAGPQTDELLTLVDPQHHPWLRPTKGVHIVLRGDRLSVPRALVAYHPRDARVLFVLPFFEHTVVGTTDTDLQAPAAGTQAAAEEVAYLLAAANHYFPDAGLRADDVLASWSGVRPLLASATSEHGNTSAVSREHRIAIRADGIIVVAGGKLTTYRRLAAETLEAARPLLDADRPPRGPSTTADRPLPGASGLRSEAELQRLVAGLREGLGGDERLAHHLATTYGVVATRLVARVAERPALGRRIVSGLPFIWAEVAHAAREELALNLDDVLVRRVQLFYRASDQGLAASEAVAEALAEALGWSADERARQVVAYHELVARNRAWRR
ncbi:MAG: glycerol-3-phosphate dehydrogenase/oxidase [Proteobacteria bacterium]|nr:glycerol-3-phosphate dehydrogenase/oxidase [Pseudomonadota bacterium]